jgi:hypothetical protein
MNSPKLSIKKIIGSAMTVLLAVITVTFLFTCLSLAVDVPACTYFSKKTENVFETIHIGDTKDSVIAKLGRPTDIQFPNGVPVNSVSSDCHGLCVERLRYSFLLCLDLDEWHVDIDRTNHVIQAQHLISP